MRNIQKLLQENGAQNRLPGKHAQKPRGHLTAIGVFQEVHCDGHEKLSQRALEIGDGIGIDIYGMRDHTGRIHRLKVVPNARNSDTIGHFYLDFAEEYKGIFETTVSSLNFHF